MLVINGADDVHMPQDDTVVFEGRRNTTVKLVDGTGHCAVTKLDEVVPVLLDWLAEQLTAKAGASEK
jgi:esterase FrsA